MINLTIKNKARLLFTIALFFFASYILNINLGVSAFLLTLVVYLKLSSPNLKARHNLLYLAFLFVIIFVSSYFILRRGWPAAYIPFCVIPMLATLLFNELRISLLITVAAAVAVASLAGNNFNLGLLFLTSGIISSALVFNVRRRMQIISAGFIVGLTQMVILFFLDRFNLQNPTRYLTLMLSGLSSGVIVIGVLPVFEYLFKTVTNISLLELADFNHPLLQRMITEAPGTYHHSLIVGNLSEAACNAVGAHALLARIGAYYHDIGKLQKPIYFSENQNINESQHDSLSPTMSKMVIMNHVRDGLELAKKYKLNPRLVDFIMQHHGKSLVYYFYRRALENIEEDQEIQEEGFRYPGPKPDSKETAIVLLADSVEAACRALKDPTPPRIEGTVHKIINNKFIDGQLDECELTLKDLEKISAVFIHILSGIYHSRAIYPEEKKSENNHKKPTKEDSRNHLDGNLDKKSNS
ncbi:MAG: HDIG domain-containing metalloprotein [Candidatus Omnitrophota bacterium]